MVKRVGLLTLPLHTNYGGIIQIVALYQFLAQNGQDPLFLRKKPDRPVLQRLMAMVLRNIPFQNVGNVRAGEQHRALHYPFIDRFMPRATGPLRSSKDLARATRGHKLDAVVVGSDQVWRFDYHADTSPMNFLLDFIDLPAVRKISYAASFGHGTWKFPQFNKETSRHLSTFHAVSVREESGVDICRTEFGRVDAQVVLDPTLLVDPAFYTQAVASGSAFDRPTVVKYVLDQSDTVQSVTASVIEGLGKENSAIHSISPEESKTLDIPHWLQAFRDADFVITDSFHGTIFAILFRKRFVTVPNHERGLDRFTTILGRLGLSERLLTENDPVQVAHVINTPIDYEKVETRLHQLRKESADFLLSALA